MTITNLGTLQSAVESWMERSFDDALFAEFATTVTDKLERGVMGPDGETWLVPPLRCRDMITSDTVDTATGAVSSWLEFERLWIDGDCDRELLYRSPQQFLSDPRSRETSGNPQIYTMDGVSLRFGPQGDATLQVTYYIRLNPLLVDADTNIILTNHPRVYQQGCMSEACDWLGDYARSDREALKFAAAVRALNAEKKQTQQRGSALVMTPQSIS